jgi:hypothetical protein
VRISDGFTNRIDGSQHYHLFSLILSEFQEHEPTRLRLKPRTPISAIRNFDRARFQVLYKNCRETPSAYDKGIALENLAEYLFLCLPGLGLVTRRLRTLAEEGDLAFSNEGDGFLRTVAFARRSLALPTDSRAAPGHGRNTPRRARHAA